MTLTLPQLVHALTAADVSLSLRLVVDAPPGAVSPEIKAALAEYKPIVVALAREAQWQSLRHQRWGPGFDDAEFGIDNPGHRRSVESLAVAIRQGSVTIAASGRAERRQPEPRAENGTPFKAGVEVNVVERALDVPRLRRVGCSRGSLRSRR